MTKLTGVVLCTLILLFISGSVLHADEASEAAAPWIPTQVETSEAILACTTEINRPKEIGTYYAATIPDTLEFPMVERTETWTVAETWGVPHG